MATYEKFKHRDPNFLVTFHNDQCTINSSNGFTMHWHENIEILYFTMLSAPVHIDDTLFVPKQGDLVVVNSNSMHAMNNKPFGCSYHCLILDKQFCENAFIPISKLTFNEIINDAIAASIIKNIASEMENELPYYKSRVQAYCIELLVLLSRNFSQHSKEIAVKNTKSHQRTNLVKNVIGYITSYYKEPISIEQISEFTGFSRYYICHAFKDVTGQTIFDYINIFRCNQARKMLGTGKYNISESAFANGFNNLSYFARTYKKHIGTLPSDDLDAIIAQQDN